MKGLPPCPGPSGDHGKRGACKQHLPDIHQESLSVHVQREFWNELRHPALVEVMRPRAGLVISPEEYFKASAELMALTFGICWLITVRYNFETIRENPLKLRLGYNNLCVGLDTPPALYVGSVIYGFIMYFAMRFAWLDWKRTELARERLSCFSVSLSVVTDILYMCTWSAFSLVFVIHPWENVWGHTCPYLLLIIVQWFVVFANVWEAQRAPVFCWVYTAVYGIISVALVLSIVLNYAYFDQYGHGPLTPWWLGFSLDYSWFVCVSLMTVFLPNAEELRIVTTLHDPESDIVEPEAVGLQEADTGLDEDGDQDAPKEHGD